MPRDDFTQATKSALAKRAGYMCSKPACRAFTVGPSRESVEAIASVGIAAHIRAASPGGPRFDTNMTSEERQAIENGIWLCSNHATLIDRDVARFGVDALTAWKRSHETYVEQNLGEVRPHTAAAKIGNRQISDEAARICAERESNWEDRLLAQLLRDEITAAGDLARDLRFRVTLGPPRWVEPSDLMTAVTEATTRFRMPMSMVKHMFDNVVPVALGRRGEPGDPELIAYAAARLGDIYKISIQWGLDWMHTRCRWLETKHVLDLLPEMSSGVQRAVAQVADAIDTGLDEAVSNGTGRVVFSIDMPVPEAYGELMNELDRLGALATEIVAGRARYDLDPNAPPEDKRPAK